MFQESGNGPDNSSDIEELIHQSPPLIQAVNIMRNASVIFWGEFMNDLEQKKLMINSLDETNPQKIKIKRLKGNAHSLHRDSTERELKELAIPTRHLLGGYIQYLISGKWWTAPQWTKESGNYLDPLPYIGGYDELGR